MIFDSRNINQTIACPEPLCTSEFASEADMIKHVSNSNHQYTKIINNMDNAISYYVQQKHILNVSNDPLSTNYLEHQKGSTNRFLKLYPRGWARKVRKVRRFTEKQKQFLKKLFYEGAAINSKLSAEQMADRMKYDTVNGQYYFNPEEYLQPSQIRGYITRLKKQSTQTQLNFSSISEDDGIEENLDNICDFALFELHSDDEDFEGFDEESII